MQYSTILVTGCGGDIGSSIGKILKMSNIAKKVIGCDVHNEHAGSTIFDNCFIIPTVHSTDYIKSLSNLIHEHSVDLIIPASEPELRFLLHENFNGNLQNIPLIHASLKAMMIGFDKLLTTQFLQSSGLPFPWTTVVKEGYPLQVPCIIKSREGAGSKDVIMVEPELVDHYIVKRPDDIWQEYLGPDDQEYTCGIFRSKSDEIRTIIIKRKLQGGQTIYGEVIENKEIEQVLLKLAESIDLRGSINAQLRLTNRGPVIFEINPRFSSTVLFRHLLGFKDLMWSLAEQQGGVLEEYSPPLAGTRFYRGSQEIIFI